MLTPILVHNMRTKCLFWKNGTITEYAFIKLKFQLVVFWIELLFCLQFSMKLDMDSQGGMVVAFKTALRANQYKIWGEEITKQSGQQLC